ncbi:PREDICTED: aluminum-activated malate transporter 14-like [Tarenaya hassleriana]|uniref:aluminum-activated malate transporter 14-like n=1 Tax=Tarenaya hassleriana TaxID=28532 RepID=UPI00053C5793|nr:PREDICTED: aluminum-activated malate transporter 14-like [Tarenaya hassleriana]
MTSTVIDIAAAAADGGRGSTRRKARREGCVGFVRCVVSFAKRKRSKGDVRRVVHSVKVGFALVLAFLLYLLDPLYKEFGDNAMCAIMTVIITFEFFAGATLSKGLNRGIGTILGGGLGCLAAALAQEVGGLGNVLVSLTSVFIFGAGASYSRLVPSIKKTYDHGVMVFILTFNLVVVSGVRAEKVLELVQERLLTIIMGFCLCIFISLLVFPVWASDELNDSLASRFRDLSVSIEGCLEEYFSSPETKPSFSFSGCKSVLHSKLKDETLVDFAKWEPRHGRFRLFHPWDKYLQMGELLRDLAATILSLEPCLKSSREASKLLKQSIEEPCELAGATLAWILMELGDSVMRMRKSGLSDDITLKLKTVRRELSLAGQKLGQRGPSAEDTIPSISFLFALTETVNKVEEVAREVEELAKIAYSARQVPNHMDEIAGANLDLAKECEQMCQRPKTNNNNRPIHE